MGLWHHGNQRIANGTLYCLILTPQSLLPPAQQQSSQERVLFGVRCYIQLSGLFCGVRPRVRRGEALTLGTKCKGWMPEENSVTKVMSILMPYFKI